MADSSALFLAVLRRFDQFSRSDVSEVELRTFAQHFEIPVLRIRNVDNVRPSATGAATIDGKASLLVRVISFLVDRFTEGVTSCSTYVPFFSLSLF